MFAQRDESRGLAGVVDVGFTDRYGGVSTPPYDSLDLSLSAVDRSAEVSANLHRLAEAFDVPGFALMHQVHGNRVVVVTSREDERQECDALVTDQAGVALCVRVGDCVPVVLADPDRGVVAVAHAGRQGVAAGVAARTVEQMRRLGAERVSAWLGPHICGGCYEVPPQMRADVAARVPTAYACTTWGTPSLDLGSAVRSQLAEAGVASTGVGTCTRESPDFYSHRRDGAAAGRSGGVVVLREHAHV